MPKDGSSYARNGKLLLKALSLIVRECKLYSDLVCSDQGSTVSGCQVRLNLIGGKIVTQATTECNALCHPQIKDGDYFEAIQGGLEILPRWAQQFSIFLRKKEFLTVPPACLHLMGG